MKCAVSTKCRNMTSRLQYSKYLFPEINAERNITYIPALIHKTAGISCIYCTWSFWCRTVLAKPLANAHKRIRRIRYDRINAVVRQPLHNLEAIAPMQGYARVQECFHDSLHAQQFACYATNRAKRKTLFSRRSARYIFSGQRCPRWPSSPQQRQVGRNSRASSLSLARRKIICAAPYRRRSESWSATRIISSSSSIQSGISSSCSLALTRRPPRSRELLLRASTSHNRSVQGTAQAVRRD